MKGVEAEQMAARELHIELIKQHLIADGLPVEDNSDLPPVIQAIIPVESAE